MGGYGSFFSRSGGTESFKLADKENQGGTVNSASKMDIFRYENTTDFLL